MLASDYLQALLEFAGVVMVLTEVEWIRSIQPLLGESKGGGTFRLLEGMLRYINS